MRARPRWRPHSGGKDRGEQPDRFSSVPLASGGGELSNLKSNETFLRLQDELAGTENRIAVERRKYNEVVQAI